MSEEKQFDGPTQVALALFAVQLELIAHLRTRGIVDAEFDRRLADMADSVDRGTDGRPPAHAAAELIRALVSRKYG